MPGNVVKFKNSKTSAFIFVLAIIISAFWILGQRFDVYHNAFIGVVFEILWFPLVVLIIFIPIFSFIRLWKEKFNIRSLYLYSLIITSSALVYLTFFLGKKM
jgi:hypothetical protein